MTARLAPALLSILALGACEQAPVREGNDAAVAASAANAIAPDPATPAATELPALTGRVVDNANLLSADQEAELVTELAALERRTTDQFVIVTMPSLGGRSIEAFATALGNRWGVGQRDKDNGVLLVVAPTERRVRIAVGRGLEAILTNERAQAIIDRDILPALSRGEHHEAISAGTHQIAAILLAAENQPRGRQR